ncbi:unnamed protein product [Microthlaspi erraticum]|uniref:Uncharacterized protein n=1 Tax=Microthlaspi erraticum TaxID=1685480 RepID=A0A6D2JU00_9BRAS|nr:unnamed protein product [Microthlaspi erraticum]
MGRKEHGGLGMDAAQLDTQRKKEEAILKTRPSTRPTGRVPQLDRPSFNSIELRSQQSNPKNVASPLTSFDPKPNPLGIVDCVCVCILPPHHIPLLHSTTFHSYLSHPHTNPIITTPAPDSDIEIVARYASQPRSNNCSA